MSGYTIAVEAKEGQNNIDLFVDLYEPRIIPCRSGSLKKLYKTKARAEQACRTRNRLYPFCIHTVKE